MKYFLQGCTNDPMGVFLNLMVIYLHILTWLNPVIMVIFNIDPFQYFLSDIGVSNILPFIFEAVLRYFLSAICAVEMARSICIFVIAIEIVFMATYKILFVLSRLPLNQNTAENYLVFCAIRQRGDWMERYSNAIFLGIGFVLCVLLNTFSVVGWKIFPLLFYLCCVPLTIVVHFLIHVAIPLCVRCNEISVKTIKYNWKVHFKVVNHNINSYETRFLHMKLRSFQAVSFHSGNMATIDKMTRMSYLAYISSKTADCLILSQEAVQNIQNNPL